MNKRDRGILYGLALGDGCLHISKDQSPKTARLVIGHGPKQLEYLEEKKRLLHSTLGGKPPSLYTYRSKNKKTGKVYTNHQLYKNHKYFRQMHRVLYSTGKKKITEKVLGYLTDYSLALLFMDDGSGKVLKNKVGIPTSATTRIATYCTEEEALLWRKWFEDKYSISPKFDVDKRSLPLGYSLRFNTTASKELVSIIAPYIVPCLKYKIQHIDKYMPKSARHPSGVKI